MANLYYAELQQSGYFLRTIKRTSSALSRGKQLANGTEEDAFVVTVGLTVVIASEVDVKKS